MNKAIVIGSINMDIVAFVKQHPKVGETVFGRTVNYFPGGKGANQAVACKRLGCDTLMLGRIGDDAFGEQLLAFQKKEGIDTTGVRRLQNASTGTAFVTVSDSSENSIVVISGANSAWDDAFMDDVTIEAGDLVLAQFEIPDAAIRSAFEKAQACGAKTLLNPAPVRPIDPEIQSLTDVLILNEHELAALSGLTIDPDCEASVFDAAAQLGYRTVIVTLADKGVKLLDGGKRHSIAARPVIAVDSTGAGDTFIGGLAAGLLSGMDLPRAAEFGNAAASISVTREGAAASIPSLAEVNQIIHGAD